jgi:hypothetical protein
MNLKIEPSRLELLPLHTVPPNVSLCVHTSHIVVPCTLGEQSDFFEVKRGAQLMGMPKP